jgi:hypothetical protein
MSGSGFWGFIVTAATSSPTRYERSFRGFDRVSAITATRPDNSTVHPLSGVVDNKQAAEAIAPSNGSDVLTRLCRFAVQDLMPRQLFYDAASALTDQALCGGVLTRQNRPYSERVTRNSFAISSRQFFKVRRSKLHKPHSRKLLLQAATASSIVFVQRIGRYLHERTAVAATVPDLLPV